MVPRRSWLRQAMEADLRRTPGTPTPPPSWGVSRTARETTGRALSLLQEGLATPARMPTPIRYELMLHLAMVRAKWPASNGSRRSRSDPLYRDALALPLDAVSPWRLD